MRKLRMTLNGSPVERDVHESRYLSEVLRGELGLHGTKIGCNEAECGICTVLVNGTPVSSCVFPAFKAQDAVVETIAERYLLSLHGVSKYRARHIAGGSWQCE